MGLDIWCAIGNQGIPNTNANITHNVRKQINKAGADPWEYDNKKVNPRIKELKKCLKNLTDPKKEKQLRRYDPSNGWGSLEDSTRFIKKLLDIALMYPEAKWQVWK